MERSITVLEILESEGNKIDEEDKYNRVDLLCKNSEGEIIVVEVHLYLDLDYFHRILFGISKVITEHIHEGQDYDQIKKVISINIIYFDLGDGNNYIYHRSTIFKGKHLNDLLTLGHLQQKKFSKIYSYEIYTEIFIVKVNNYNDVSKTTLDEWIYFLKNTALPVNYTARGLKQVAEKLNYEKKNAAEKLEYDNFIKNVRISKSVIESTKFEGREEGREEGFIKFILQGFDKNYSISLLSNISEFYEEEVINILRKNGRIE